MFGKGVPDCHRPQEYHRAVQVPPLKVPAGLDTPNTQGALVIPALDVRRRRRVERRLSGCAASL